MISMETQRKYQNLQTFSGLLTGIKKLFFFSEETENNLNLKYYPAA